MVIVRGQQRRWGRQMGALQKDTLVVEWQPRLVDATNNETIRGGDGAFELMSVSVNSRRIDGGLVPDTGGKLVSPSAAEPDARLPTFRIRGSNPNLRDDVLPLIDALVQEFFNAHNDRANVENFLVQVEFLPLPVWQETMRRVLHVESGSGHFDKRTGDNRHDDFRGVHHGLERDMPIFGPPHGYGISQLDDIGRAITVDEVWNYMDNIRAAIGLLMRDKAGPALNFFTHGAGPTAAHNFTHLLQRRQQAMLRREAVRRYNGGQEFQFESGKWVIHTTADASAHAYPNNVLGTSVAYPGPTDFRDIPSHRDFGPGF